MPRERSWQRAISTFLTVIITHAIQPRCSTHKQKIGIIARQDACPTDAGPRGARPASMQKLFRGHNSGLAPEHKR